MSEGGMWTDEKAVAIALVEWLRFAHGYEANTLEEGLFGILHYTPRRVQVRNAIEWLDKMAREGQIGCEPTMPAGGWD